VTLPCATFPGRKGMLVADGPTVSMTTNRGPGMRLEVNVPDSVATSITLETAKKTYAERIERYAADLFNEASRLAIARSPTNTPEIVGANVEDADLLFRRGYVRPRGQRSTKVWQVVSTVCGIGTGLLAD